MCELLEQLPIVVVEGTGPLVLDVERPHDSPTDEHGNDQLRHRRLSAPSFELTR